MKIWRTILAFDDSDFQLGDKVRITTDIEKLNNVGIVMYAPELAGSICTVVDVSIIGNRASARVMDSGGDIWWIHNEDLTLVTESFLHVSFTDEPDPSDPQSYLGWLVEKEGSYGVIVHVGPIKQIGNYNQLWASSPWSNSPEEAIEQYNMLTDLIPRSYSREGNKVSWITVSESIISIEYIGEKNWG